MVSAKLDASATNMADLWNPPLMAVQRIVGSPNNKNALFVSSENSKADFISSGTGNNQDATVSFDPNAHIEIIGSPATPGVKSVSRSSHRQLHRLQAYNRIRPQRHAELSHASVNRDTQEGHLEKEDTPLAQVSNFSRNDKSVEDPRSPGRVLRSAIKNDFQSFGKNLGKSSNRGLTKSPKSTIKLRHRNLRSPNEDFGSFSGVLDSSPVFGPSGWLSNAHLNPQYADLEHHHDGTADSTTSASTVPGSDDSPQGSLIGLLLAVASVVFIIIGIAFVFTRLRKNKCPSDEANQIEMAETAPTQDIYSVWLNMPLQEPRKQNIRTQVKGVVKKVSRKISIQHKPVDVFVPGVPPHLRWQLKHIYVY